MVNRFNVNKLLSVFWELSEKINKVQFLSVSDVI